LLLHVTGFEIVHDVWIPVIFCWNP